MNETDTILPGARVGYTITVVLTTVAAATILLVDITYIIVSLKALKKTFYHLTILVLFFSDIICGVSSSILFSLGSVIKHEKVGPCLLQIFLVTFGLQSNYCLIFLLCLQRYLVVRSFNFGTSQTFDRNKFVYIGGALCIVFILSFCGTILSPRTEFMQICRPASVYGDSFYIFVMVTTLPVTVIIFLLLIMSLITSFRLLKFCSKGKVAPMHVMREDKYNNGHGQSSILTTRQSSATSSTNVSVGFRKKQIKADISIIEDLEIQQIDLNIAATNDNSEKRKLSKKICSQNCHVLKYPYCKTSKTTEMKVKYVHSDDSNCENKVSTNKDNGVHEKNSKKRMIDLKSNTNICTTSNDVENSIDVNTQLKTSWEIRAFLTTIIIAFQTVILTGPFVASFWIEVLSISNVTMQSRLLLSIPFLINSFSNPFLYAWRIPEIRQELRKLFRINT